MKKFLFIAIFAMLFCGCDNIVDNPVSTDIQKGNYEKIRSFDNSPIYVLVIEVHQVTATLDIGEHVKNKINDIELRIPVDKRFYDYINVGESLTENNFKMGSLIFNGDASVLNFTVKEKFVIN